jgi:hypothetical protein
VTTPGAAVQFTVAEVVVMLANVGTPGAGGNDEKVAELAVPFPLALLART